MEKEYDVLEYYNKNAKLYFEQTVEADFEENYSKFLCQIPKGAYILDFGCGSGRDSKYFLENGYKVKAIDGSIEMCKLASEYIGQEVQCMKFDELDDEETFDGVWACSSILHVEKDKLPEILEKMARALKKNGVIFVSFKKGEGYEIKEGKYYNFMSKDELQVILQDLNLGVEIVEYFDAISSTKRPNRNRVWANFILKRRKDKNIIIYGKG